MPCYNHMTVLCFTIIHTRYICMPGETGWSCRSYIKNKYLQQKIRSRPSRLGWVKHLAHQPASSDGPSKASASMPVVVSKALFVHSLYPSRYFEEGIVAQLGYHNPTALAKIPILFKNIKNCRTIPGLTRTGWTKAISLREGAGW